MQAGDGIAKPTKVPRAASPPEWKDAIEHQDIFLKSKMMSRELRYHDTGKLGMNPDYPKCRFDISLS